MVRLCLMCIINTTANLTRSYSLVDIIGVCEVIEDRLSIQPPSATTNEVSEKERRKRTSRMRAVIENLCVRADYRKCGIGMSLVQACEEDVQSSWPGYDEVFSQVEVGNTKAYINYFKSVDITSCLTTQRVQKLY